jgi:hypothetical protein
MYCVSLDPGVTTGVCIVKRVSDPWSIMVDEIGPGIGNAGHHRHLFRHLALWNPDVIVCEAFENRGNDAAVFTALEYIGVVKAYAQGRCKLVIQSASTGKAFWNDDKLRKYGVYATGQRHARDACRHYLYYRTFTQHDQSLIEGKASGSLTRRIL